MTASFIVAGLDSNNPELSQAIRSDYTQSSLLAKAVNNSIGRVTRPLTAMFYDTWDTSVTKWFRIGTDIAQRIDRGEGVNLLESYVSAGLSISGQAAKNIKQGNLTPQQLLTGSALGTGIVAGREQGFIHQPGAGRYFENALIEGATVPEAMTETEKWVADTYGADIVNEAWESAELTQLHVTFDGVDYGYGVSLGRLATTPLAMMNLIQPKSIPSNIMSAAIDGTTQVFLDPWDPIFNQATRLYKARKALQPAPITSVQQAIQHQGGVPLGEVNIRGPLHGQSPNDVVRQTGIGSEDWVFHGGKRLPEDAKGIENGGITRDITTARKYALENGEGDGVVYAMRVDELPKEVQKALLLKGEIEQFVELRNLIPVDELNGWVGVLTDANQRLARNSDALKIMDEDFIRDNPQWAEFIDEYESTPVAERMDFEEAADAWLTTEERVRREELFAEANDLHNEITDLNYEINGLPIEESASIYIHTAGSQALAKVDENLVIAGSYSLPSNRALEVTDVDEMLEKRHLFPEGKQSMDDAYASVIEEPGVVRSHGYWEPKSPEEFIPSTKGQKLVSDLMDQDIPKHVKMGRLHNAGVPWEDIQRMFVSSARGKGEAAQRLIIEEHLTAWINGQRLTESIDLIPRDSLRAQAAVMSSVNRMTGSTRMTPPKRRIGDWGRRWMAVSTMNRLDPWDYDTNFDTIVNSMDTLGASPDVTQKILDAAWDAMHQKDPHYAMKEVLGQILDEYEASILRHMDYNKVDKAGKLVMEEADRVQLVADVRLAFNKYYELQNTKALYNINQVGAPLAESDSFFVMRNTSSGLSFRTLIDSPVLDSELSITHVHVPSIREMRQATSKGRELRNSWSAYTRSVRGQQPEGLMLFDQALATKAGDIAFSTWRNMQLLRVGWMMSVIPDEMARAFAQGHSQALGNPMFLFHLMTSNAGGKLPSGRMLQDVAQAQGGLGIGSFGRGIRDTPLDEAMGSTYSAWVDVNVFDEAGNISYPGSVQLARNYSNLYNSKLVRQMWEFDMDVERTVDYLINNRESPLWDIVTGQGTGAVPGERTRLGQLRALREEDNYDEMFAVLTKNMEIVKHRMILLGGGDYLKRSVDDPTQWLNSGGAPINTYTGKSSRTGLGGRERFWNKTTMREELTSRAVLAGEDPPKNLHTLDGTRVTEDDLRTRLMQQDGIYIDLSKVEPSKDYAVIKQPDQELMNIMGSGRRTRGELDQAGRATNRRRSLQASAEEAGVHQSNQIWMVEEIDVNGVIESVGFYAHADRANSVVARSSNARLSAVDTSTLTGEQFMTIQTHISEGIIHYEDDLADIGLLLEEGSPLIRTIDMEDVARRAIEMDESSEVVHLSDEMTTQDMDEFAEVMRTSAFSNEYSPPDKVRGPSEAVAGDENTINEFITSAFRIIGQKPSEILARNPYSKIRAWETGADFFLYASPAIRRELTAKAIESGLSPRDWDRFVARSVRLAGLDELPKTPAAAQLTMAQIEQIMVTRAIEDTRDLFFDLSKRGNWADALKLIFPFGDAWWEVLTRWTKLMNPIKTQEFGKPFRNLRRMQQLTMAAERSGWFDTDMQGERVFTTYPGPALVSKLMGLLPEGVRESDMVRVGTLGFLNFADTRSVLAPGTSPAVQFSASVVRPYWDDNPQIMNIIDTAVYGGFQPSTMKDGWDSYVLPTYLKNLQSWMKAGEYDLEFASLQIDIANAMVVADPVKWENLDTDVGLLEELMLEARSDAATFGFIKIFSSWIVPSQPQLLIEVVKMGEAGEVFMTPTAIANDLSFLSQYMDPDEALETVRSWYGTDPLSIARKSYAVTSRPLTQSGYNMLKRNPDAEVLLPYTVAAFMPPSVGDEFYSQEYQRQLDAGDRQKLTLRQAFGIVSYKAGQLRMEEIKQNRNETLHEAEAIWGKDSDVFKDFRDNRVTPWYNDAKRSIEAMHFGYAKGGGGAVGVLKRPTYEMMKDEMLRSGEPGTAEYDMARRLDPELTNALQQINEWWVENDKTSINMNHEAAWWYSGDARSDWTTAAIRAEFSKRLRRLVDRQQDEETKQKLKWYVDYIVTPLLNGYDLDSPFIVTVDPLLIGG
jgi:hypothetical protein